MHPRPDMRCLKAVLTVISLFLGGTTQGLAAPTVPVVAPLEAVDKVWAGHYVSFALISTKTHIVAGYYDANRQLSLAQRPVKGGAWVYKRLPVWTGWDSHNYIAMGLDRDGRIHLTANMHVDPLIAFQTEASGDIRGFRPVPVLVDPAREQRMTYPVYLHDKDGRLIFKYRDGTSGNGNEIYDVFDEKTQAWSPLFSGKLTDGEGQRNAYFMGPKLGSDGYFHITWVWRESPMAETNHDLSYAKSPDLIHWLKSDGTPYQLPIKLSTAEIVDPVPVKGGMINNNTVIGFDDKGRAMITYHKYDGQGDTQIMVARKEGKVWRKVQVSQWENYRWDFKGGGSLNSEIFVEGARPIGEGRLSVPVVRLGKSSEFIIRSSDLSLVEERPVASLADHLKPLMTVPEGQQLNVVQTPETMPCQTRHALVWATRPPQRDKPSADIPPPSDLKLVTLTCPVASGLNPVP